MLVERTNMFVKKVTPRKQGSGEGMELISALTLHFEVPRVFIDRLIPDQERRFSDQFFSANGDVRLTHLYPLHVYKEFSDLNVAVYFGKQATNFRPARMSGFSSTTGILLEPLSGGYVGVTALVEVSPTPAESGKLDSIAKEVVEIGIDHLNRDIEDAGPKATDSE